MPMLCFPCSPSATAAYLDEKDAQEGRGVSVNVLSVQKPTTTEYTGEAAKQFLSVLEAVAQEIPVPGLGPAVKVATNLIKACEESYATLEKAEELKLRIKTLVTAVVNELKEKKADEIREKLKDDINALQLELKYIEKKLGEIASQHAFLLVFFRSLNDEKVQKCLNRLDSLLERFTIARHIDHTTFLDRLEKEIIGFYNTQKQTLDHIQDVMEDMNVTMKDVKAMMSRTPVGGLSSSGAWASVPANTGLFYGRDSLVLDLVAHIIDASSGQTQHHTCILGPGGMGKTSIALAVMAHPGMKKHYPGGSQIWVPCVKATSVSFLLETLGSSLGITQMKGNIRDNILSVLKSSGPLVLLFDNFETPWNADGGRSEAERILGEIGQIPHVTLFVTMRSSSPPCKGLIWHSVELKAVDTDAARRIYCEIQPDGSVDPQLPALLQLVGNMPLAVTLMATTASLTGLSAEALVEQYAAVGPTLLSQGSDPENSMDICISLSVDSPPMKRNPEAQWLLATLSMLPTGTTFATLSKWWVHRLSNPAGALKVLRETSLVERQGIKFSILPVIQRYVLDPIRFDPDVRASVLESACQYLRHHKSSPGDELFKEHAEALNAEEGNLEAILLTTHAPSIEVINALVGLANYQATARPRTNIVKHALDLVLEIDNNKSLHAAVLLCSGHISFALNLFEDAQTYFSDARELFISVLDIKKAAECLFGLLEVCFVSSVGIPDGMIPLLFQAQSELESIGDMQGVAKCWLFHGRALSYNSDYEAALHQLYRAHSKLSESSDPLLSALCSDSIASAYYWKGDMEQAETWVKPAVDGFDSAGVLEKRIDSAALQGAIFMALGKYAEALQVCLRCLEQSKALGLHLHMGLALQDMGISWMKMGKKDDARAAFKEALEVLPLIQGRSDDRLRVEYFLRMVDDPDTVPSRLERMDMDTHFPERVQQLLEL